MTFAKFSLFFLFLCILLALSSAEERSRDPTVMGRLRSAGSWFYDKLTSFQPFLCDDLIKEGGVLLQKA